MIIPSWGLRQGDPLSPYLFLMVSEGLTGLFQKADREGFIHGVKAAAEAPVISHLLFADDSLLFSKAHLQEVIHIQRCLLLYESAAGQKINFQKSAIAFVPGISDQNKAELSQMLGVPIVECHERYLGLPTTAGRSKKSMFKARKFVLVKAVAQAIPAYSMSVFKLPKGDRNKVLHGKRGMEPRNFFEKCMDWQCEIARVELERKNSLRGSVREREEVCENGEDGNNSLSEHVATLFFDGACDSKADMADLGE
ncbi:hypothetical protein ACLB2K_005704 [Fragaria x ananassa]